MIWNKFFNELYTENSLPPTLYSFMESIANFEKENKVKIKDLAQESRSVIFDFSYPISEALNKSKFEELFLKHFMFRRINYDTLLSFKLHLEVKLNDIMPKYNKMMEGFNSLVFDGVIEIHERTLTDNRTTSGENSISTNSSDNTNNKTKFSDTPQNRLQDIDDSEYVSEYTDVTSQATGSSSSSSTSNSTDNLDSKENIIIKRGDPIEEYGRYLEVASSIYEMIFKECDSLFYGII